MVQQEWANGFGVRLGRAIDRWPGGGQRAFEKALKAHAARNGLKVPTSYRTLINYLNEATVPSEAWIDAAAEVLRWNPDNIKTGAEPERLGEDAPSRYKILPDPDSADLMSALLRRFINRYVDLSMPLRLMLLGYLIDHFDGVDPTSVSEGEVDDVVRDSFSPLLSRPTMSYLETMAYAATLMGAAYIRLAANHPAQPEETNG